MTTPSFSDLGLIEPLRRALLTENYLEPTPIQARAIPALLAGGDLLGIAQTGTGKTAAFALPILQRLAGSRVPPGPRGVNVLILAPTRELAIQIDESFRTYGRHLKLRHAVVVGGVGLRPQIAALARGVDILVATPGRLLDHLNQRHVQLGNVSCLVLDEADRMLDMGFIRDVRKIMAALPKQRQSLLFSATMPAEVEKLAGQILHQPTRVEVTPKALTVDRVVQRVLFVDAARKTGLLGRLLMDAEMKRVLVFTRTKHRANRVAEQLEKAGVAVDAIHGNKAQGARQRALDRFRTGAARVLVATDIAARGIDVDGVTHVINFELPNEPESYVHRIGRTARAGAAGIALSFCDPSERAFLRDIERLTRRPMEVVDGRQWLSDMPIPQAADRSGASRPASRGAGQRPSADRDYGRAGASQRYRPAGRGRAA